MAVQQTLGGAWADVFDVAPIVIRISGHTGWRGPDGGAGSGTNGEDHFHQIHNIAFVAWHAERAAIVAGGGDPNVVTSIFVDTLNGFVDLVAPKSFTLRRSKTRPLLLMYTIEMLVLQPLAVPVASGVALPAPGLLAGAAGALGAAAGGAAAAAP
jgi:hypothetical protein